MYGQNSNLEYFNYAGATRKCNEKKWYQKNIQDMNRILCYQQSKELRVHNKFIDYKRKEDMSFADRIEAAR